MATPVTIAWDGWSAIGGGWSSSTWGSDGAVPNLVGTAALGDVTTTVVYPVYPTGVEGTAVLGSGETEIGAATVLATGVSGTAALGIPNEVSAYYLFGVAGTAALGVPLVWGEVDDSQTPNWADIASGQVPAWQAVDKTQTPGWTPVVH